VLAIKFKNFKDLQGKRALNDSTFYRPHPAYSFSLEIISGNSSPFLSMDDTSLIFREMRYILLQIKMSTSTKKKKFMLHMIRIKSIGAYLKDGVWLYIGA